MRKTARCRLQWIELPILVSLLAACASTRSAPPALETVVPVGLPLSTPLPTRTHPPPIRMLSLSPTTGLSTPELTGEPTLTPAALVRYTDPSLGFVVGCPADWEIAPLTEYVDALAQVWSVIEFRSNLYGYGEQAFGRYVVTVGVSDSQGRTLAETLEYSLSPIAPSVREGIESNCCLTVHGEPAVDLLLPWPMGGRWGSRQIMVIHDGRQYRLTFYPQQTLDGVTPSDAAARAAFDTFLRTFRFIPVTATATPARPTVTPAPTPTSGPGGGAGSGVYLTEPTIWIERRDIKSSTGCSETYTAPPAGFCQVTVRGLSQDRCADAGRGGLPTRCPECRLPDLPRILMTTPVTCDSRVDRLT